MCVSFSASWSRKHHRVYCRFSIFGLSPCVATASSNSFFFFALSGTSCRNYLVYPPLFCPAAQLLVFSSNDTANKFSRRGAYLQPSTVSRSLFPHLFFLLTSFFGLEVYCFNKFLRHGSLSNNRPSCASWSCSLCPLSL